MQQHQVGGTHYISKSIQPWDAMQAWLTHEEFIGFLRGNVIRYIARYRDKGGIEDLKKATHYNDKLIAVLEERLAGTPKNQQPSEPPSESDVLVAFAYQDGSISFAHSLPTGTFPLVVAPLAVVLHLLDELAAPNPQAGRGPFGGAYIVPGAAQEDIEENATAANLLASRMIHRLRELAIFKEG